MAIIMPINFLLDSNYMYVNAAPEVNNPLVIGDGHTICFLGAPCNDYCIFNLCYK